MLKRISRTGVVKNETKYGSSKWGQNTGFQHTMKLLKELCFTGYNSM
jgi:hypothetical protein